MAAASRDTGEGSFLPSSGAIVVRNLLNPSDCIQPDLTPVPNSNMAELTDHGRQTTLNLGRRLRHLYVHQLGFLPDTVSDANMVYLRSSPWPRTLDSLQQVFTGLYPPAKRDRAHPRPTIVMRRLADETLMPNEDYCERFIQLAKAFSKRTADRCEFRRPEQSACTHAKASQGINLPKWIISIPSSNNGCHPKNA